MTATRVSCLMMIALSAALATLSEATDLKSLVDEGLKRSPRMQRVRSQVESARLEKKIADTDYLPNLDLQTSLRRSLYSQSAQDSLIFDFEAFDGYRSALGLNTRMVIWDGGLRPVVQDLAQQAYSEQRAALFLEEQDFIADLLSKVVAWVTVQNELKVLEQQRQLSVKQYRLVRAQFKRGLTPQRDFLRYETEIQRNQLNLEVKSRQGDQIKVDISVLVGRDRIEPGVLAPLADSMSKLLASAQDLDLSIKHPLPLLERLKLRQLTADLDFKKRELELMRPRMSLDVSGGYGMFDFVGPGREFARRPGWHMALGFSLEYPLWDWFVIRNRMQLAAEQRHRVNYSVQEQALALQASRRRSEDLWMEYKTQLHQQQQLFELESKNYAQLNEEFQRGKVGFLDMVGALRDLSSAELAVLSLSNQVIDSSIELMRIEGRLYAWLQSF